MSRPYISVEVERRIRAAARDRCSYCLSPQHLVMTRLQMEHIVPLSKGGSNDESNLWLACPLCNAFKASKSKVDGSDPVTGTVVLLFNPRTQIWSEHFAWTADGLRIVGKTPVGRATVIALHLDSDPDAITVRSYWIAAGWHPPQD